MAIQFDQLPKESPFALPKPDVYKAKIVEAEMRKAKSTNPDGSEKPPYLNLKYQLTDHAGKGCGAIYDIIAESTSNVVMYKIGRFAQACGIPLVGSMELSDMAKLVLNKEIVIDVNHDTKGQQPRAQVDLFTREAYYPIGQFDEIYALAHAEDEPMNPPTDSAAPAETPWTDNPDGSAEEVEY
jgi:hypothetical protein